MKGIEITLEELIKARPAKSVTGFAPSGKVSTHQWGMFRSAFLGQGMEFAESRVYQTGDDVRNIDWRITARTGKTHTKLFHEERERPIYLLVDMRSMMHFATRTRFKANMVAEIASMLAWVGFDGGDRVGGQILTRVDRLGSGNDRSVGGNIDNDNSNTDIANATGIVDFRGARTRRAVLRFLERLAEETRFAYPSTTQPTIHTTPHQNANLATPLALPKRQEVSLAKGIHRLRKTARTGSLVFVLSDFYDFDEQSRQELVRLSAHSQVTLIQVNDPLDKALPAGAGRLSDGLASIDLSALTNQQLQGYSQAFLDRQQQIYQMCAKHGMVLHQLLTSDDVKQILGGRK
ncbi:MAG: hypothetical protein CR966_00660 [Pseudomonadales bacterium]|nr:MAG: hypothetical protein CR966_00660 [Pseudomonadales bacterium]